MACLIELLAWRSDIQFNCTNEWINSNTWNPFIVCQNRIIGITLQYLELFNSVQINSHE